MFWISLAIVVVGTLLVNLGAMSVMVTLLAAAFKVALVVILFLAGLIAWRWCKNKF